jgi:hypothetical protein
MATWHERQKAANERSNAQHDKDVKAIRALIRRGWRLVAEFRKENREIRKNLREIERMVRDL